MVQTAVVCKFLKSKHRQLKRQVIQRTVYLAVSKLFNVLYVVKINSECHFVYYFIAIDRKRIKHSEASARISYKNEKQ